MPTHAELLHALREAQTVLMLVGVGASMYVLHRFLEHTQLLREREEDRREYCRSRRDGSSGPRPPLHTP